jgi:hypothetical protein
MKRITGLFFIAFAIMGIGYLCAWAPSPTNSIPCVGGPYYVPTTVSPIATGKLDSVGSSATDTFKLTASCNVHSLTFSNICLKVAGSPTVTVALYASSDGGLNYGTAAITTYTVVPTSLTVPLVNTYIVNQNGNEGNPYTNYMWVASNSASATCSWQGSVLPRS